MSMDIVASVEASKPKQSWADYLGSMPPGRAPGLRDIADRWNEFEEIEKRSVANGNVTTVIVKRSKENGEERAYQAWLLGLMEPEEELFFGMLSLRSEALTLLAIVPIVRELTARIGVLETAKVAR